MVEDILEVDMGVVLEVEGGVEVVADSEEEAEESLEEELSLGAMGGGGPITTGIGIRITSLKWILSTQTVTDHVLMCTKLAWTMEKARINVQQIWQDVSRIVRKELLCVSYLTYETQYSSVIL